MDELYEHPTKPVNTAICPACKKPIEKDQSVYWTSTGVYHEDCYKALVKEGE